MFEFNKLCNEYEKLNPIERGALLAEKSVSVIVRLGRIDLPDVDPLETFAAFILGSIVSDGTVNEKDFLYIYPSLVKVFGNDFDFASVKRMYKAVKDVNKEIERRASDLIRLIAAANDDTLTADIITLCLLTTSVDGKISYKEKRYVRRLYKNT